MLWCSKYAPLHGHIIASAETAAPLVGSSIYDHWSKRANSSIRRISSTLTLAILDGKLYPAVHSRCYSRLGSIRGIRRQQCWRNEVGHLSLQESDGARVLDAPVHRPVERQNSTLGYPEYVWQ